MRDFLHTMVILSHAMFKIFGIYALISLTEVTLEIAYEHNDVANRPMYLSVN